MGERTAFIEQANRTALGFERSGIKQPERPRPAESIQPISIPQAVNIPQPVEMERIPQPVSVGGDYTPRMVNTEDLEIPAFIRRRQIR